MRSNNYAVEFEVNIPEWLETWDWSSFYLVLSRESQAPMPSLVEMDYGVPTSGKTVKSRIANYNTENMRGIDWGNGHKGLCLPDECEFHYIFVGVIR